MHWVIQKLLPNALWVKLKLPSSTLPRSDSKPGSLHSSSKIDPNGKSCYVGYGNSRIYYKHQVGQGCEVCSVQRCRRLENSEVVRFRSWRISSPQQRRKVQRIPADSGKYRSRKHNIVLQAFPAKPILWDSTLEVQPVPESFLPKPPEAVLSA